MLKQAEDEIRVRNEHGTLGYALDICDFSAVPDEAQCRKVGGLLQVDKNLLVAFANITYFGVVSYVASVNSYAVLRPPPTDFFSMP